MSEYTTIKLPNEIVAQIDQLVGKSGYKSRTEVVKEALRDFFKELKAEEIRTLAH